MHPVRRGPFSNGESASETAVISADGQHFVTH